MKRKNRFGLLSQPEENPLEAALTRIMSKTQENAVFVALPKDFTIETVAFNNVSKVYVNQMTKEHSTFPVIALNFSQSGVVSELRDLSAGAQYYKTMLTIHILAKHYDDRSGSGKYVNGALICKGIAQSIMDTVKTWTNPITGDIRIFDPDEDIHALENKGQVPEWGGVFDYVLWIDLYHS